MQLEWCPSCNEPMGLREDDEEPLSGVCATCEAIDDMALPVVIFNENEDIELGDDYYWTH